MFLPFLYLIVVLLELFFVMGIAVYMLSLLYSSIRGAPYVPSKNKQILAILTQVPLRRGMRFIDLGCGDGRVVRLAAQNYKVTGVGVDINPLLIFWARLKARLTHTKNVSYEVENVFKTNLGSYDVIYLFMMPQLITKLKGKLKNESKKKAVIISHGFKIEGWGKYCYKTLKHDPFPTYFYRLGN